MSKTGIDINKIGDDKAAILCKYFSDDDGLTWNKKFLFGNESPVKQNNDGNTLVFMNTIGQVHKIEEGELKGRLILAAPMRFVANNDTISNNFRDHVCNGSGLIFSDDKGETWQLAGKILDHLGNEASAVSVNWGEAVLMIRRLNKIEAYKEYLPESTTIPGENERLAHKSMDGGKTWSEPFYLNISDVKCHGTLAKVNKRLYFSIPAGRIDRNEKMKYWDEDRVRGAIYFSDDDGLNWNRKIVEEGYFSYSTVGKLTDEYRITFFSRGGHGRFGIGCRVFTDKWLEN